MEFLKKMFGFDPSKSNIRTEMLAGITTFVTMSYILAVNPDIFSSIEGMPGGAVFTATALAAIVGCLAMAMCGKFKKITPTMYVLAVLFILKFIFI